MPGSELRLELRFEGGEQPVLAKTRFASNDPRVSDVVCDRSAGKTVFPERPGPYSFAWTFVQFRLIGTGDRFGDDPRPVRVLADDNSPANTLWNSLRTRVKWRDNVLEPICSVDEVLESGVSAVELKSQRLKPESILLFQDGSPVSDAAELRKLASGLEKQWLARKKKGPKPPGHRDGFDLTSEESDRLSNLATQSIRMSPERLPFECQLVIGLARRIQLALGLEAELGKVELLAGRVVEETLRYPKDPKQICNRVRDSLIGFAECSKVVFNQGCHWEPLKELAEKIGSDLEGHHTELQHVLQAYSDVPEPDDLLSSWNAICAAINGSDDGTSGELPEAEAAIRGRLQAVKDRLDRIWEEKLDETLGVIRNLANEGKETAAVYKARAAALVESAKSNLESTLQQLECAQRC